MHRAGPGAQSEVRDVTATDTIGTARDGQGDVRQAGGEPTPWVPPTWEEIVEQHSARVYRLAYRLTGNQHDAEDLTQEVFVRVFRSLSSYTPGTFEGWLHRITTNPPPRVITAAAALMVPRSPPPAQP